MSTSQAMDVRIYSLDHSVSHHYVEVLNQDAWILELESKADTGTKLEIRLGWNLHEGDTLVRL